MDKIKILVEKKYKIVVGLFFAAYLFAGISVFKDYGISWDEPTSRNNGIYSALYVMQGDNRLLTYKDRNFGTAFEILLVAIEARLNLIKDTRATYLMRHLVTFLLFYTGVFFFYRLCIYRFRSWKIGLLGSLFLILSPRIFAHSFYNSKDIAFFAMFIISMYTMVRYLDKKTLSRAAFHALTCAYTIDIRMTGIILPFFTIVFYIDDLLMTKTIRTKDKKIIASFLIYIFLLGFFTVLFWPILWSNPVYHFIEAFKQMSNYQWGGTVLYLGKYVRDADLPWHYIPVWMIISTPVLYTACFFIGCFAAIRSLLKNRAQSYLDKRRGLIFISWFLLPLAAVICLRSPLYDSWRHMFFIYPGFLMLSLAGLTSLFRLIKRKFQKLRYRIAYIVLTFIIIYNLLNISQFMVKYHPHQNVYFNRLAGRDMEEVKNNFELDYWGLSYRKALEYILKNDTDKVIKIYAATNPGKKNAMILKADDRKRLVFLESPAEAKYFLSSYRWHRGEYPYKEEYYSIKIDGAKIMVVYRL